MCQLDILRLLAEEGPMNIYEISNKRLGYRYAHVHKSVKVLKALGLVREQESYYKRRKMLNVAITHFGYIVYLAAWKEEASMKRSLERSIYMQRNLFPDLSYVYWLISDKEFEEEDLPEDFYLLEALRFRSRFTEWALKGQQGQPPFPNPVETRRMGKKPNYSLDEFFKAMCTAARRDMIRLRVKLRASPGRLPPSTSWPRDIVQRLTERGEAEFDTFLPAEVLSPMYEEYDAFLPEVEEDGSVYCPAAEYYYGVGLAGLFGCARLLYSVLPSLLSPDESPLGIVNILSRPDRIFAGMVFKELELRGLPEKRTIEIEGEGIKLIIEPVRARKITSS